MNPFFVTTALSGMDKPSFDIPSPATFAKAAVATIGIQDNTFGCFSHALQVSIIFIVPLLNFSYWEMKFIYDVGVQVNPSLMNFMSWSPHHGTRNIVSLP